MNQSQHQDQQKRPFLSAQVTVKFFHNSIEQSNALCATLGITEKSIRSRREDMVIEKRHEEMMRSQNKEEVRPGVADSGDQVFGKDGLRNAMVSSLIVDMLQKGFRIVDAKRVRKPKKVNGQYVPGKFAYITEIYFTSVEQDSPAIEQSEQFITTMLQRLEGSVWQFCHVWDNGGTFTVNCAGGEQTSLPRVVNVLGWNGSQIVNTSKSRA